MKRFLLSIFASLLCLCLLTACGGDGSTDTTAGDTTAGDTTTGSQGDIPDTPAVYEFSFADLENYTVVFPFKASDEVKALASSCTQSLEAATGGSLDIRNDFLTSGQEEDLTAKEILIGEVDRSLAVTEGMKYDDYYIVSDGRRIAIGGGSVSAIETALEVFTSQMLDKDAAKLTVTDTHYRHDYSYETLTLNGKDIPSYVILAGEKDGEQAIYLQEQIVSLCGIAPKIVTSTRNADVICVDTCSQEAYANALRYVRTADYKLCTSEGYVMLLGGADCDKQAPVDRLIAAFKSGDGSLSLDGAGIYYSETVYPVANPIWNGLPLADYCIACEKRDYASIIAAELLQSELEALTGYSLPIVTGTFDGAAIVIADSENETGTCTVTVDGKYIRLQGMGITGAYTAVKQLLATVGTQENVTIASHSEPMFLLNNTAKRIQDGALKIGFIGDSVTAGAGGYTSWSVYLTNELREAYPDTTFKTNNVSIGGKNTMWGAYGIEELLLKNGYSDLLFIALGTNDQPYGARQEEMAMNMQAMVEKARAANPYSDIVFVICARDNELRNIETGNPVPFISAMLEVAAHYRIPVVDPMSALQDACDEMDSYNGAGAGWSFYISDTVHPNNKGQRFYALTIWNSLSVAIDSCKTVPELVSCYMPEKPLYTSKVNAEMIPFRQLTGVTYGQGDAAGWSTSGTVTAEGATVEIPFTGIGCELAFEKNVDNAAIIRIEILDEDGEVVLSVDKDTNYYYHYFITADLPAGNYTLKLTMLGASPKNKTSAAPVFNLTNVMIIAEP